MKRLLLEFDRPQNDSPPILVRVVYDTLARIIEVSEDYVQVNTGPADGPYPNTELPFWFCTGGFRTLFKGLAAFPYAQRIVETEAHNFCTVGYNRLGIVTPVTTTLATTAGSFNGTATILAFGYRVIPPNLPQTHRVGYSLDNKKWQYTNQFKNLKVGQYTVYVREEIADVAPELWDYSQANFVIDYRKIYTSRYYLNFKDEQKETVNYRLNILAQNVSLPAKKVCGGESPVVINYPEADSKYEVIRGSNCALVLIEEKQFQFLPFYSADERRHRVDITRENQLYWRGYILPEQFIQPFLSPPYPIQVQAVDGLGTLKKFPYLDKHGNRIAGERPEIDIIFDCLDKLDLDLPLQSAIDVYEDSMFETANVTSTNQNFSDPLFQARVNTSAFVDDKDNPLDCDTVLRRILSKYGARIYQSEGKWRVECIDAKRQAYWRVNWRSDRRFESYEMFNPVVSTQNPRQGNFIWINNEQQIDIEPAFKNTTVTGKYQVITNVIPGGEFKKNDFTVNNLLKDWAGNAPYTRVENTGKESDAIRLGTGATDEENARYIQSRPFYLEKGDSFLLQIGYFITDTDSAALIFQLEGAGYSLYYKAIESPELEWKAYDEDYRIGLPVQYNSETTYQAAIPDVPVAGNYTIRIFEPILTGEAGAVGRLRINFATLQVLPKGENPLGSTSVTVTNPFAYTVSADAIELGLLDTPKTTNSRSIYANYIAVSGTQSNGWHIKGNRKDNSPLTAILASNVAYNHTRPSHKLTGTLIGNFSYQHIIHEQYDLHRLFFNDGLSINVKKAQYQVTLRELIVPIIEPIETGYDCGILLEDKTGFIQLEDKTGVILLESC